MKKLIHWINCNIWGLHEWTCKSNEGINPTITELRSFKEFSRYAEMYCRHCNKQSKLNNPYNNGE